MSAGYTHTHTHTHTKERERERVPHGPGEAYASTFAKPVQQGQGHHQGATRCSPLLRLLRLFQRHGIVVSD